MKALANKATLTSSRTWFGSYVVCGARAEAVSAVERLRRIVARPAVEALELRYVLEQCGSGEAQTHAYLPGRLANAVAAALGPSS